MSLMGSCGERDCIINSIYNCLKLHHISACLVYLHWGFHHLQCCISQGLQVYSRPAFHRKQYRKNIKKSTCDSFNKLQVPWPTQCIWKGEKTTNAFSFLICFDDDTSLCGSANPFVNQKRRQREAFTCTFMHLADAFMVESDLYSGYTCFCQYVCSQYGIWTHNLLRC